ncbi:MAG: hypothetical protein IT379_06810 [Deltaproteobacteria bacterium]|nr:hypothetical protein [Deltaproteobacteria bacterium]
MASFGLKCLGDVAALPRGALAERIGRDGALIEQLARGEHRPPLVPAPPVLTIEEGLELEGYLETFEPLGFLLRPAIERLVGRLVLRGLGCAALELHLSLDPSGVDARTVTVAVPTRDVSALLALVRLSMDARPPDAPVDGFRLVAHAGELRPTQLSLFAPAGPAPGALATTMARLSALVGPERVGSPRVPWTRRPGAIETVPFEPGSPPVMAEETPGRCLVRAMRRVSPPLAVEVEMDERGRLCAVRLDGQRRRVLRADGPYVVEGGWWSEESYRREEHDVTLAAERGRETLRARLVADSGAYYVDAVYDG